MIRVGVGCRVAASLMRAAGNDVHDVVVGGGGDVVGGGAGDKYVLCGDEFVIDIGVVGGDGCCVVVLSGVCCRCRCGGWR